MATAREDAAKQINVREFQLFKSMAKPPDVLVKVVKATFILLGHSPDELDVRTAKQLLTSRGPDGSLPERLASFEPLEECNDSSITAAKAELEDVGLDKVMSSGGMSFAGMHMWCTAVIQEWDSSNN